MLLAKIASFSAFCGYRLPLRPDYRIKNGVVRVVWKLSCRFSLFSLLVLSDELLKRPWLVIVDLRIRPVSSVITFLCLHEFQVL